MQHIDKDLEQRGIFPGIGLGMGNYADDLVAGMAADNNGNINFSSEQAYAINSNSTNKRASWEFIKFLASEEMQMYTKMYAFQINNKALEAFTKLKMTNQITWRNTMPIPTIDFPAEMQETYDNYIAYVDKFSDMINTYTIRDSSIDIMIYAEVKSYFNNIKPAAEVAQAIQSKVELYMNE